MYQLFERGDNAVMGRGLRGFERVGGCMVVTEPATRAQP